MAGAGKAGATFGMSKYAYFGVSNFVNLASLLASVQLLVWLSRLSAMAKARVFIRQLRWLTTVDLCFHSLVLVMSIRDGLTILAPGSGKSSSDDERFCLVMYPLWRWGRLAGIMLEMIISLTFFAQAFHWFRAVKAYSANLRAIAVACLGVTLAFTVATTHGLRYEPDALACNPFEGKTSEIYMLHTMAQVGVMLMLAAVTAVSNIAIVLKTCLSNSPNSVPIRNLRRAAWYNLNFLISWGGICIYYFCLHRAASGSPKGGSGEEDMSSVGVLSQGRAAILLEYSSGLLNALTYGIQMACVRHSVRQVGDESRAREESFHVEFDMGVSVLSFENTDSLRQTRVRRTPMEVALSTPAVYRSQTRATSSF